MQLFIKISINVLLFILGTVVYCYLSYILWRLAHPFIDKYVPPFEKYDHELVMDAFLWPILIPCWLLIAAIYRLKTSKEK